MKSRVQFIIIFLAMTIATLGFGLAQIKLKFSYFVIGLTFAISLVLISKYLIF